ncbi:hypothetical protein EMCRGX_G013086 [Ephydatia muelleri]
MSCVALTSSLKMASPAPPLPGTGADGGGRASGTSGEGDGTGGEGYSLVSEYWGNGLSIYDPEGNKIHTVMAVVMFSLWVVDTWLVRALGVGVPTLGHLIV